MAQNTSSKEIEALVKQLKQEVQTFKGNMGSKEYIRLHNKLIELRADILTSKFIPQKRCDQLLVDLRECLKILTAKVCDHEDTSDGALRKSDLKRSSLFPIEYYENEVDVIENEINEVVRNNDYNKRLIVEGKIKIFLADLSIARHGESLSLSSRKNRILDRLKICQQKISEHSRHVAGMSANSGCTSLGTSTGRSSLELKDSQFSRNEDYDWECDSYEEIYPQYIESVNENPPPIPPKPKSKESPPIPQRPQRTYKPKYINSKPPACNENNVNYTHAEIPHSKMNFIRAQLLELLEEINSFNGKYKDRQYVKMEVALLNYKKELKAIHDEGYDVIKTSKKQYADYIDSLLEYLFDNTSKSMATTPIEEKNVINKPALPKKPQVSQKTEINLEKNKSSSVQVFPHPESSVIQQRKNQRNRERSAGIYTGEEMQKRFFSKKLERIIYPPVVKEYGNHGKQQIFNKEKKQANSDYSQVEATIKPANDNAAPHLLTKKKSKNSSQITDELLYHLERRKQKQKEECSSD